MPYLLLGIGVLVAFFALYRFIILSEVGHVRSFLIGVFWGAYGLALLFLSMSGRLPIAIILVVLCIPLIIAHFRRKARERKDAQALPPPEDEAPD